MANQVHVLVLLTGADEGSTPLESARLSGSDDVKITICDFWGETDVPTFDEEVLYLGADSTTDISAYKRLYHLLKDEQIDVLHMHPIAIGVGAALVAQAAGVPNILTTEHSDHRMHPPQKKIANIIENSIIDIVVCNSEVTRDSFSWWENAVLRAARTRIETIHYGANIELIDSVTGQLPLESEDGFVAGYAGRLAPNKNLSTAIKAMARVPETVELAIAGEGPEQDSLEELATAHGVRDRVHFLGWLDDKETVFQFYNSLDVFLSLSNYEGFGMSNAEAMASGVPVVANNTQIMQEVLGDAGVLVDAERPANVAEAMESLLHDEEDRMRLSEAAKERIRQQYSMRGSAEQYTSLYQSFGD